MEIFNAPQGSAEWHAKRLQCRCASEAGAAAGKGHISRQMLLKFKKTGIAKEIDSFTEKLFEKSHKLEALARPNAEDMIGDDLFPVVGITGKYLASFDGLTMDQKTTWECKTFNKEISEYLDANKDLPDTHWPQVEQQLFVSGASQCLFTLCDDTGKIINHLVYSSKPERLQQVFSAWDRFYIDLESYDPSNEAPVVVGTTMEALPALRVEVTGMVTASNLDAFKSHALACISDINTELATDQDFADAEKAVKWCAEVEKRLESVKEHALSQTQSIDELFKTIDMIKEEARTKRLAMDKLIKNRKETIKINIVSDAQTMLNAFIDGLNVKLGGNYLVKTVGGFADAIKGKKTLSSMGDAIAFELSRAEAEVKAIADKYDANLKYMRDEMTEYKFLFSDTKILINNDLETLKTLCQARVAVYEAEAAKKLAEKNEEIARHAAAAQYKDPEPLTPSAIGVFEKTDGAEITDIVFDESSDIFFPSDDEIIAMLQTCYNKDRATIVARLKLMKL